MLNATHVNKSPQQTVDNDKPHMLFTSVAWWFIHGLECTRTLLHAHEARMGSTKVLHKLKSRACSICFQEFSCDFDALIPQNLPMNTNYVYCSIQRRPAPPLAAFWSHSQLVRRHDVCTLFSRGAPALGTGSSSAGDCRIMHSTM